MEPKPPAELLQEDPELQQLLAEVVALGTGFTARVFAEHKRRWEEGLPPESYFKTESQLDPPFAGKAKLALPARPGFEYVAIETPPAIGWPENGVLKVRHHVKKDKEGVAEVLDTYIVHDLGSKALRLTATTEDVTERNIWKRARNDEGPRLHEDFAVHMELANARIAQYNHQWYQAKKAEEALGLHRGGMSEAHNLMTLLTEGILQMPGDQETLQ